MDWEGKAKSKIEEENALLSHDNEKSLSTVCAGCCSEKMGRKHEAFGSQSSSRGY